MNKIKNKKFNKYIFKIIYFLFSYINIPYEKEIKYINNL